MKSLYYLCALVIAVPAYSELLFEADFESGIPYVRGTPAHPGGGFISFLGGEIGGGVVNPGDGDDFYGTHNNVILDSSEEARNPLTGSTASLKTHYKAGSAHRYQLNTTIIKFPENDTVFVRWYQKWSSNFVWPGDQQKLIKVRGPGSSQNFPLTGGRNFINLTYSPNGGNQVYVFPNHTGDPNSSTRKDDSIPDNENFPLERNRWYCIEIQVQSNTPGQNDAVLGYWIDDDLKLQLVNANNRGSSSGGIHEIELQHVYQTSNPPSFDQPTWMDDIVVSTERIGCVDSEITALPNPPHLLSASIGQASN